MASWFSYIRNTIIGEELPSADAAGDGIERAEGTVGTLSQSAQKVDSLSCTSPGATEQAGDSFERQHANSKPSLSQEQREHIKNVLRRAERSGRNANVVVDARHLKRAGAAGFTPLANCGTKMDSSVAAVSTAPTASAQNEQQKEDDEPGQFIVQMDSLPEDVEVSVGPYSYCSYASSEMSYSEADKGYSSGGGAVTEEPPEGHAEKATAEEEAASTSTLHAEGEDGKKTIAQKMQKLSKTIDQWLKSLDREDSELEPLTTTTAVVKTEHKNGDEHTAAYDAPCTPVSAVFDTLEQPTILLDYLDTLSQSICVMATEHSANKLFERQFELVNQLSNAMANEVIESVLRLAASSTIEEPSKNAIDEAAHLLLDVVAHSVEQNEKLEIVASLKALHSVDLKPISMDQLETGDHNCYTILVEERDERRMTEEAINFVPKMPTTLTTMRSGCGGGLSSKSSSFSSTNGSAACPNSAGVVAVAHRESFESGSTSGADSELSSSDSVDVGTGKMPFAIVPTEKEQLLIIGSPKEEQMFDIVPKVLDIVPKEEQKLDIVPKVLDIVPKEEQLLDIVPKEKQLLDIVPKVLDIVPKEEQLLDIVPKEKQLLDIVPKVLDIVPMEEQLLDIVPKVLDIVPMEEQLLDIVPMEEQLLDIVPMEEQLLDIVPMEEQLLDIVPMEEQLLDIVPMEEQLLDIVPMEEQFSLEDDEACSSSTSGADSHPETERDIHSPEDQLVESFSKAEQQHLLDTVTPKDEQKMDSMPTEEQLVHEDKTAHSYSCSTPSTSTSGADSFHNAELDANSFEEFDSRVPDQTGKEPNRASPPATIDDQTLDGQIKKDKNGDAKIDQKIDANLLGHFDWIKKIVEYNSKEEESEKDGQTSQEEKAKDFSINGQFQTARKMPKSFDSRASTIISGADTTSHASTPEIEEGMIGMDKEQQLPNPIQEERAQIERVQRLAKEEQAPKLIEQVQRLAKEQQPPKLTEEELAQIERVQRLAKEEQAFKLTEEEWAQIERVQRLAEEQQASKLTEEEWAQIERVQRLAEEQQASKLTEEEWAQIERVQRLAEEQQASKLTEEEWAQIERVQRLAEEQQASKLTEEEWAQIERVQRLAEEQQASKLTEEEWAQIEQVQRLAEEQQASKLTEEEWAQIERVQRLAEGQQLPKPTEEWAQIERVQRLAEEQQAPKLIEEEWAQIEQVQRLAEEQQASKLTEEEWAQIERVQRLAEGQQLPKPTEEWAQIERVQRLAEEQQASKLTEEEWAQIEQVQRLAEEQQASKLTEEELAQIERIRQLAEQCSFEMMVKSLPRQEQNVQFDEDESFIKKNSDEEMVQFEHGRHANDWWQHESLALKAANGDENDKHGQSAEQFEHTARLRRQIDNVIINQSSLSLSPSTSSANSINSSSGSEETKEGWPQDNGTRKASDSAISAQIDDQTTSCQQPKLPAGAASPGMVEAPPSSVEMRADDSCRLKMAAAVSCSSSALTSCASYSNTNTMEESISPSSKVQHQMEESGTTSATSGADSRAPSVESIERAEKDECTMPESGRSGADSRDALVESIERAEKDECTMPESGTTSATSGADSRAPSVESIERAEKDECTMPESGRSGADSRDALVESIERAEKDECTMPESGRSGADSRDALVESIERAEKDECTMPESGRSGADSRDASVESIERAEKDECTMPESGRSGADSRDALVESIERAEKDECTMPESGRSGADSRDALVESIERAEKDECTMPESGRSGSDSRDALVESIERAEKAECTVPESGTTSATSGADSRAPSVESIERAEKDECTMPESGTTSATSGADSRAPSVESIERAEKDECTMPESGRSGADSRDASVESIEHAEKDECTMPESGRSGADSRDALVESIERAEKDECTMPESGRSGADSRDALVESIERAEKDECTMPESGRSGADSRDALVESIERAEKDECTMPESGTSGATSRAPSVESIERADKDECTVPESGTTSATSGADSRAPSVESIERAEKDECTMPESGRSGADSRDALVESIERAEKDECTMPESGRSGADSRDALVESIERAEKDECTMPESGRSGADSRDALVESIERAEKDECTMPESGRSGADSRDALVESIERAEKDECTMPESGRSGADSRDASVESIEHAEKDECTVPESGRSGADSRDALVESIERAEKDECTVPESGTTSATSGADSRAPSVESIERAEKDECTMPESGTTSATSGADSRAPSVESIERAEKDECTMPESGRSGADSRDASVESIEHAEKDECTMPESGRSGADSRDALVESIERAEKDECTMPESGRSGADSRDALVESIERAEKDECTMPESGTSGATSRAPSVESIERADKDECTVPESGTTSATSGADSRAPSVESIERAEKDECTMPESGRSGADSRDALVESIERAEKDECTMPESGRSGADSRDASVESIEHAEKDECTVPESGRSGADSRDASVESIEHAEKDECTMPESGTSGATSRAPSVESIERAEKDECTVRELLVVPENKTDSLNDMQSEEIKQLPDKDQLQELSIDELAHIERIRQLAEQCSFEMMVKSLPRQEQNVQFGEDENTDNKRVYGEDKDRLEHGQEEWAHIERVQRLAEEQQTPKLMAEEQQPPKLTEEEWAQIERVQRLAEEQQAPKLAKEELAQIERVQRLADEQQLSKPIEEWTQIERVQRLAEEQQPPKLTEEEWAQIERVQRLADEQQPPKLTEEEWAQIERVQRLADEQQLSKPIEEWTQIERVQRLAEEQQPPKLTEEELAHIEQVQRMAEEQQLSKPIEEWTQIERVQRLAEEQQPPKLTEEEWAQIERVQRLADEQQPPKLTEEEWAQIERVQRLADEQQLSKPIEEWTQIERVQRLAEEQQPPKLTEEELAHIEQVQRMAEEQQLSKPIEEWTQFERVQRLADEQQLSKPIEEWTQIERVQRLADEQQPPKLTQEEGAQIERVQMAEACGSPRFDNDRRTFDKKDALIDKTDHIEHDEGWSSASTSSADSNPSLPGSSTDEHLDHIDEHIDQLFGAVPSVATRQKNDSENGGVLAQQRIEEQCSLLPADESSSSLSTSGADSVQSFERAQLYEPSTPLLLSDHDMEPSAVDAVHMQHQSTQKSPQILPSAAFFANNNMDEKLQEPTETLPPMPMPMVQCLAESIGGEEEGKQDFSSKSINENAGQRHEMPSPVNESMREDDLQQLAQHKTRQLSLTTAAMNSTSTRSRSSCSVMMMSSNIDQRRWLSFSSATSDIDDNNTSLLLIRPDDDPSAVTATGAVEEKRHKQYSTSSSTEKRHKQYSTSSSTSSVNIVFTDHKLRRSFCVDHDEDNGADVDNIVSIVVEDDGFQAVQNVPETTEEEVADQRKTPEGKEEDWANNIDFMIKLNFFAQRLSEEIADEAARDITNIIHIKQNPRALYFDDKYCELLKADGHQLHDQICSSPDTADDGWTSEQQQRQHANGAEPLLYEVREMTNDEEGGAGRGGGLKQELISQLSVFTGLMRRRSAANSSSRPWSTTFLAPRATTFSSSDTATTAAKRKESIAGAGESGGIMELLRRPSTGGTVEEGGADELPESALVGLSREEREHILKVVAESRRSPSAQASRSSSCSLHVRPEQVESKSQWTKPIEDATTQFSSTEIQQRISNDQQQRPEEVQEVHTIGMKIFDGEDPKAFYAVSKTEEFLENLSKTPEELNVECGAVSCGEYLPKTEEKIEAEAIMDDDVEQEEDEAVQSVNEFLHSEDQNPPMAPLDVPTVMEDEQMDGMAMAMETYQQHQQQMAKSAEAGWMSMFTLVEKKAKQIGTSMPASIQSISAQIDLIKRNVDIQSLSDQFKRITDKKDIVNEHSEKPVVMNNEHAEVHALTDPSMPSFWAHNAKGAAVEEQHLVIDHAKNAAAVDASRSSSSGFGDTIDDQQMGDDDGESFWHGQHRASVEQTARFVSSEINLFKEELERMDNILPPLFSETDQEQAILPPSSEAIFEVPAPIVECVVEGPVSRPTDSAPPPAFCTSICAKNAYGGLAPGAEGGGAPRGKEKEIEHFGWEAPEGTMEEEGDGRVEEMDDDDKWTEAKQKLEEKEEGMAKKEEKHFICTPGAEGPEGNEHFGTTTTMEEEEEEEEEEGREEAYEEQREESQRGRRGRSIDWKCQEEGEKLSANGRDGRPPPLLAPSEEAAAAAAVQPLAAEHDILALAHTFAPGATVGISAPPSKSIWLEDGREIGGLESSKTYESAAGGACNSSGSSSSSGGRGGGAPFSVCLPPSSPAATSAAAAAAAAAAEANPFSLPQFPSPPAVKGENQKTKQKVAFTGAAQQQHSHSNGNQRDEAVHVHGEELGSEETRFVRRADEVVGDVPWAEGKPQNLPTTTDLLQQQLQDHSRVPTPFVAEDEQPQQHQSASIKTFPSPAPFTSVVQSTPLSIGKMFFLSTSSSTGGGGAGGGGGQKQQQQQQTSSSFAGFGNKFGKLASDTLKGAKQAKEKAVTAMAQAGQTLETAMNFPAPPHQDGQPPQLLHAAQFVVPPQRPHSSLGLPIGGQSSEMPSKSSSLYDISLPPGFDLLSEEEQLRIISVMQCAELDAQLDATNANANADAMPAQAAKAATKTDDKQRSTVVVGIEPADSLGIMPSADLNQLSHAEEAVHAVAVDGQKHERHDGMAGIELADEVMEGEAEDAGLAKGGVFMDTSHADGLDLAQYGQPTGMFRVETGDDHRRVDEVQQGQQYQTESGGGGEEDDEPWMQPPMHKFTAPLDQWEMPIRTGASRKQLWTTVFTDENDQQQQQKAQPSSDEELGEEEEDELLEQISMDTVRGCWESNSGRTGGTDATVAERISTGSRSKMADPEEQQMETELTKVARSIYTADFRADNQHYHVQNGKKDQEELKQSQQQQQQNTKMVDNRRIVAEHAHNNSYEIEMDDPWSPTLSPPKSTMMEAKKAMTTAVAHSVPPIITVTTTDDAASGVEQEEDSEEDDDVETADERRRPSSSSSEEEEDGDYPDTVQSVPTVSPATIAELQERQEMEQQQMVAQVFQQIQAFGEAADDEFDVQWAKPKPHHQQQQHQLKKVVVGVEQQQQQQRDNFFMEDQANVYSPPEVDTEAAATKIGFIKYAGAIAAADEQLLCSMSADQMTENGAVQQNIEADAGGVCVVDNDAEASRITPIMYRQHQQQQQLNRTNPFLNDEDGCSMRDDADEDEDDDSVHDGGIVVRQVLLDADDRSAEELERYYKSQLDQSIYFAPRPGPVYTIPETEEEEMASAPNREAIYHAERIERKPLHSGTVPPLISPEAIASTLRRKSGGSIGRSTAVSVPPCTVTPTFDAIVAHAQPPLPSSASRTTTTTTSTASSSATTATAFPPAHLTPVRMAPPPPPPDAVVVNLPANDAQFDQLQQQQQQSMPPLAAMSAKPLSAAIHLQHQLQQLNQHKFDTNIAQQNDLPPPQWHNTSAASINGTMPPEESGGGGGGGGVVVPTDAAATASTRLKRSPAMILTGQCDLKSASALATAIKMPNGHILGHGEERHNAVTTMAEFNHTHGRPSSQQHQQHNSLSKVRKSASSTAAATDPFQLLLSQHQIVPTTQQTAALVIGNSSVITNAAAAAASSEMGRRRLPSLPTVVAGSSTATGEINFGGIKVPSYQPVAAAEQQQRFFYSSLAENGGTNLSSAAFSYHPSGSTATTSSTTTIPNLITYYTSSAPEKCDAAVNGGDVSLLNSSSESRVLFDANVVAYAQSAALGPAPWSSSSTSSGAKPFVSSSSITETTMSTTTTARTFGGGGQQQQHIDWPRSVEDLPQKGPVVIPGALYHHVPSAATRMYLPPAAAAERVPSQSMSPPRRRVQQQQQQYRSRTLERADQETHAMLNFKRELRQVLEKRRKLLDLCDIEAGHREYVINKWLHSGILPSRHRSSDIDAIPPVIKCALPSELLANVGRIVPTVLPTQNVRRHGAAAAATLQRKTTPTTAAATASSEAGPEKQQNTRTFGSQTGGSSPVHQAASRNTTHNVVSANQLLHKCATGSVPRWPQNVSDASTQTALCAETQTDFNAAAAAMKQFDGTSAELKWPPRLDHDLESHSRTTTTTSAYRHPQHGNYHWLHAPEDDQRGAGGDMRRQKRHRSRLGRFLHSDTEWERQLRERQTQQELNMRREQQQRVRHHEMMELQHQPGQAAANNGSLADGGELLMTHYYPPPVEAVPASFNAYPQPQRGQQQQQQHWTGSLPRLDHLYNRLPNDGGEEMSSMMMMSGAEHLPSSYLPDLPSTSYQQQQQQQMRSRYGYSSLPRNYERSWSDQQQQRHFYGAGRPSPAFCPNFDYFGGNFSAQSLRQQPFQQQQQQFGTALAAGGGRYSRSVQDLDQFGRLTAADNDRWWYSPSQMGATAAAPLSRSVNCLDRLGRAGGGYLSDDANQQFHGNSNAMFHRRPATNGTMNMATSSSDRLGLGGQRAADHNALLSNYANFLNNQFMLEQQHQRELDDRELMMASQQLELGQRQLDERMMEVVPPVMLEHPAVHLQHHAEECQKVLPPPLQTVSPASLPHPAVSATALGRLPPCLYSRGEHNYGVRPPPDQYEDYGNLHWRNGMLRSQQQQPQQQQPLYGQQDWINNNNFAYGAEQYHQPQVLPMPTASSMVQQQQLYMAPPPISALSSYQQQPHISRLSWPSYQRQQQAQVGAVVWPNEQQQQRHLSSVGDRQGQLQQQQQQVRHPPHGILRRPRNSPPCSWTTAASNSNMQPSSDFYGRRDISRTPRGCFVDTTNRPLNNNNNSRNVVKASRIMAAENCFRNRSAETKRILLTRHYKHDNIFKDLGIRVVGGKKLSNGDLGAFITMLDTSKAHETLGELREGDQILEWNGVLLGGKTFEEVERVIQASNLGEIELIVRSRRNLYDNGSELEDDEYRLNGSDNECRGIYGGPGGENGGGEFGRQQRQSSTRKNIAFADSTKNGSNWHSPSEPPPIPAHRAQHNNHTNTNQQQHQSSTTTDEWCAEIKWPPSSVLRRKGCGGGGTMPSPHSNDDGYGDGEGVGVEHVGGGGGHASAGHLQVAIAYDRQNWVLSIRLIAAHGLTMCGQELPNPFIKVYLLPERKVSNKRRTKYVPASCNPIWDQLVEYSIPPNQLERHYLELTVLDYDRHTVDMDSRTIGQVLVGLGDPLSLNGTPKWLALQCAPPVLASMRNCSPLDTHFQLPNRTYYNPAVLDLLDGYPAIA